MKESDLPDHMACWYYMHMQQHTVRTRGGCGGGTSACTGCMQGATLTVEAGAALEKTPCAFRPLPSRTLNFDFLDRASKPVAA